MWNSGSEVISRSSPVSSIQYGKPSPAIAYARWVCITSFERPVVPDVAMSTATSSGRHLGRHLGCVDRVQLGDVEDATIRDERPQFGVGDDQPRLDLADQPGQLGRARGRVAWDGDGAERRDRQPGEQVGRACSAPSAGRDRRAAHPGRAAAAARPPTAPAAAAKLSVPSSVRSHSRSPCSAAASTSSCGIVRYNADSDAGAVDVLDDPRDELGGDRVVELAGLA